MALMILVPGNTLIRRNNQKVGFMRGRGRHDIFSQQTEIKQTGKAICPAGVLSE